MVDKWLNNTFDKCRFIQHSSNPEQVVSECTNYLHDSERLFVYRNNFAMCKYHYCAVLFELAGEHHNKLSCSGAIYAWGSGLDAKYSFNPVVNVDVDFERMNSLPSGTIEWPLSGKTFYYLKDSRMEFYSEITDVNCTDDFKTCLSFEGGGSMCFGNVGDVMIIDSLFAFALGMITGLMMLILVYIVVSMRYVSLSNLKLVVINAIPLLGIVFILHGFTLISVGAFVLGNVLVGLLVPVGYVAQVNLEGLYWFIAHREYTRLRIFSFHLTSE